MPSTTQSSPAQSTTQTASTQSTTQATASSQSTTDAWGNAATCEEDGLNQGLGVDQYSLDGDMACTILECMPLIDAITMARDHQANPSVQEFIAAVDLAEVAAELETQTPLWIDGLFPIGTGLTCFGNVGAAVLASGDLEGSLTAIRSDAGSFDAQVSASYTVGSSLGASVSYSGATPEDEMSTGAKAGVEFGVEDTATAAIAFDQSDVLGHLASLGASPILLMGSGAGQVVQALLGSDFAELMTTRDIGGWDHTPILSATAKGSARVDAAVLPWLTAANSISDLATDVPLVDLSDPLVNVLLSNGVTLAPVTGGLQISWTASSSSSLRMYQALAPHLAQGAPDLEALLSQLVDGGNSVTATCTLGRNESAWGVVDCLVSMGETAESGGTQVTSTISATPTEWLAILAGEGSQALNESIPLADALADVGAASFTRSVSAPVDGGRLAAIFPDWASVLGILPDLHLLGASTTLSLCAEVAVALSTLQQAAAADELMVPIGESVLGFAGDLAEAMVARKLTGKIPAGMEPFTSAIDAGAAMLPALSSARLVGSMTYALGIDAGVSGVGEAGVTAQAAAGVAIDQQVAGADLAVVAAALAA